MQFDNAEMAAVARSQAMPLPVEAPRLDLYAGIHKALRAAMTDALMLAGRVDTGDEHELGELAERLRTLLHLCAQHIVHENTFVHTAIEARAPGASARVAHDHHDHGVAIDALRRALADLLDAPAAQRAERAHDLYLRLSHFVADNFEHMLVEEAEHNAALWAHYNDAELMEIHNALVASIPPAEMMDILRWLLPAMHHTERVAMLSDMRANAPAPAWEGALMAARFHLPERDMGKLNQALGLTAA